MLPAGTEPATLELIYRVVLDTKVSADSALAQLKVLNGTVRQHDKSIAVLEDWRKSQAGPAIRQVGDLRVELARLAAQGAGFGVVVAGLVALLKGLGVL